MKYVRKIAAAGALLISAALPVVLSTASAAPAQTQINISGIVPTICRVQFSQAAAPISAEDVDLGQMLQFCNNLEGYRIVMQHPAGLEKATVSVDGIDTPLSSGTETTLIDANAPAYRTSEVRLHFASAATDLHTLSFRIEPKGATY